MALRHTLHALVLSLILLASPSVVVADVTGTVGYEHRTLSDGTEIGVWFPASGTVTHQRLGPFAQDVAMDVPVQGDRFALVVLSHGTGGNFLGHLDTANALAKAGFIVAALSHRGDNSRDNTMATRVDLRPKALSGLITYMLDEWPSRSHIDRTSIGAFGFSAGGFTVLVAAGGQPDFAKFESHCRANPDFFDCSLVRQYGLAQSLPVFGKGDERIKALVVAAPALAFTLGKKELVKVTVPVQLWRASQDEILPAPFYADAIRSSLPKSAEFHDVPGAGHFDFIAPCGKPALVPQICSSSEGFDRVAFHAHFNQQIVRFFRKHLQ
ncbi:MAG: alpha/beta hydrolase family protein [Beijerinckiaceae bacterium]